MMDTKYPVLVSFLMTDVDEFLAYNIENLEEEIDKIKRGELKEGILYHYAVKKNELLIEALDIYINESNPVRIEDIYKEMIDRYGDTVKIGIIYEDDELSDEKKGEYLAYVSIIQISNRLVKMQEIINSIFSYNFAVMLYEFLNEKEGKDKYEVLYM